MTSPGTKQAQGCTANVHGLVYVDTAESVIGLQVQDAKRNPKWSAIE